MGKGSRKKRTFGFNPNVAKLKVTKLQIVQREIDTCADLYFSFGDLVSMHLLTSAAHEILSVFDKKISKTGMLFDDAEQYVESEYLEDYRQLMKSPSIGFKHGQRDLENVVELPWAITELMMLSAIEKYWEITKCPTAKMLLLRTWILIHYRGLTAKAEQLFDAPAIRKRYPAYARREFREAFFPTFEKQAIKLKSAPNVAYKE